MNPTPTELERGELRNAQRIVVKIGTRVLTHDDGRMALGRFFLLVETAAALRAEGREVLLVSSGAVGLGAEALSLTETPEDVVARQACAAIGQSRLMGLYQSGFAHFSIPCAQILLTQSDFENRERYLNLRSTLVEILQRGAVPIINENDAVSTAELVYLESHGTPAMQREPVFGDNDQLSALVAAKLDADLLILLTDVEGVYPEDPRRAPEMRQIDTLHDPESAAIGAGESASGAGRGGMRSKLRAAATASQSGCHVVIASGRRPGVLTEIVAGESAGTWIPKRSGMPARHRWLAHAASPNGILVLDSGAVDALYERNASLLPAGVTAITGEFGRGDVVELHTGDGLCIGRGAVHCDSGEARAWCDGTPPEGARSSHALVRRDQMVLEKRPNA